MARWAHVRSKRKTWLEQEGIQRHLLTLAAWLHDGPVSDLSGLTFLNRYVEKFYSMRTQLQAISLRIQVSTHSFKSLLLWLIQSQTVRTNEQMMQSMKGATRILGSMNRSMNLPALQRIAMEFERENDIMDQRQEMMDDAIDDITGVDEEEESDLVVEQVLEEIGVDLRQAVSFS